MEICENKTLEESLKEPQEQTPKEIIDRIHGGISRGIQVGIMKKISGRTPNRIFDEIHEGVPEGTLVITGGIHEQIAGEIQEGILEDILGEIPK